MWQRARASVSVNGFGVNAGLRGRQPGDRFPAVLVLPFEDFELRMQIECALVYALPDPNPVAAGGAQHLRAAGVQVEVVNGITSGLAAATSLGVPLTHRDHAHGVILVTGHARADGHDLHWPTLAAAAAQGLTLVIYMGVSSATALQAGLQAALPATTPLAIVQHASLPRQRHALCTLGTMVETIRAEGLGSPAVIIVGNVLQGLQRLRQGLSQAA